MIAMRPSEKMALNQRPLMQSAYFDLLYAIVLPTATNCNSIAGKRASSYVVSVSGGAPTPVPADWADLEVAVKSSSECVKIMKRTVGQSKSNEQLQLKKKKYV